MRIGIYRRDAFGHGVSAAAKDALDTAVTLCEALGHNVVECQGPAVDARETSRAFFALTGVALGGLFDQLSGMMGAAFEEKLFEPYTV
ncbi:hypothetical protein [Ensifer sp. MJa1]|uniref:hypothetical protein n=1 Tax=Ensifer sp. MJa1 TaxID=2919888 RepID=UPI00300B5D09